MDVTELTDWDLVVRCRAAKNYLKRRNRRRALLSEDGDPEAVADAAYRAPAQAAETADLDRRISEAMGSLPLDQRIALALVAVQGLGEREAAHVAGCNAATLRWRLHRARKRLRQLLGEEGLA